MNKVIRNFGLAAASIFSSVAFAQVELSPSINTIAQPLYLGDVTPVNITITNNGADTATGSPSIYISTPLEMRFSQAPAGCVARDAPNNQFWDCSLPLLTSGASTTLAFQAEAIALYPTPTGNGLAFEVELTYDRLPGTPANDGPYVDLGRPFYVDVRPAVPASSIAAVPVNNAFALALLSGMVAGVGAWRTRRSRRKNAGT